VSNEELGYETREQFCEEVNKLLNIKVRPDDLVSFKRGHFFPLAKDKPQVTGGISAMYVTEGEGTKVYVAGLYGAREYLIILDTQSTEE